MQSEGIFLEYGKKYWVEHSMEENLWEDHD
jgi:hypothetical protein